MEISMLYIYWSDTYLMGKNYKPSKWPTVGDQLNKLQSIHVSEYYASNKNCILENY